MDCENPQIIEYRAQDGVSASFRLFATDDRNAPGGAGPQTDAAARS
jgi:hypothetical protein